MKRTLQKTEEKTCGKCGARSVCAEFCKAGSKMCKENKEKVYDCLPRKKYGKDDVRWKQDLIPDVLFVFNL